MSSILHFRLKGFYIIVAVILGVELIVRLLPMEKAAKTGVYLSNHRSVLLDQKMPEYDYIILGESRSMSIMGHKATTKMPYSVYNFSVPAMGSRYYTYYFRKYMRNRKKPPKAVIFAGDPSVFQAGWNRPIHDPDQIYTDSRDDSLSKYLYNRFIRRIEITFGKRENLSTNQNIHDVYWKTYSHRYLHLFSMSESLNQYTGAERLFMFYEHLPLEYATYKWREQIAHYFFGFRASYFKKIKLPGHCRKSCESTWDDICYPDIQRLQQNEMLDRHLKKTNGQINLAELKGPIERMKFIAVRSQAFDGHVKGMKDAKPDLSPLLSLAQEIKKEGSILILAFAPTLKRYSQTSYYVKFFKELEILMQKNSSIKLVEFSQKYLDENSFVDNAHYTCKGAGIVNDDFYVSVMPQIKQLVRDN